MRPEPPAEDTIAHDRWEIAHGDLDAVRARWGMWDPIGWEYMDEETRRRITASQFIEDILGIDHDG